MNHLTRELAPISESAWSQIDGEAARSLKHFLAGRRLLDVAGPHGWGRSSVDLGRIDALKHGPRHGVEAARRRVQPLVELRTRFSLAHAELDGAERGAHLELDPVIDAARSAALAEDGAIFHGYEAGGITGLGPASPHAAVTISDEYNHYPEHVAQAVATLRAADIAGPYAIALGARCFTGVTETTERGGYPVFEHLRQILGGPVVWAPAVDGAVVVSQRGGDFELTLGEDFSIGYLAHDATAVQLYLEESLTFVIHSPEAAVALTYA
ncbi:MAG: family 1 encapsulin nanocompartment shell protein [Acidimicrobiales bacterium]